MRSEDWASGQDCRNMRGGGGRKRGPLFHFIKMQGPEPGRLASIVQRSNSS
jgi:hypothetical protein